MSYVKQDWTNGDVITDSRLNHIENGIASVGTNSIIKTIYAKDGDTFGGFFLDANFTQELAVADDGTKYSTYEEASEAAQSMLDFFAYQPFSMAHREEGGDNIYFDNKYDITSLDYKKTSDSVLLYVTYTINGDDYTRYDVINFSGGK